MQIHEIGKPKGAHKKPRRVGRGPASGQGKTSGRGAKGAKSRKGATLRLGFEGGQMSLIRRLPKRGFTSVAKKVYQIINVESLNRFRKDASVDKAAMQKEGLVRKARLLVKILGEGKLTKALHVSANAFSKTAKKKIVDAGGKADIVKR